MCSFVIDECWITEVFSGYIVNLVKHARSTSPEHDYFFYGDICRILLLAYPKHCKCAWSTCHLWMWTPVAAPTPSTMHHYWWAHFWIVIVNVTLINNAFNKKFFVFSFICYIPCLRSTASLAPIHSYILNDCYNVLYLPLKFVPWIPNYPVCKVLAYEKYINTFCMLSMSVINNNVFYSFIWAFSY